MTKNLETADTIVKLLLAIGAVVFYFTHVINGPLARALMFLGLMVLIIFGIRMIMVLLTRD